MSAQCVPTRKPRKCFTHDEDSKLIYYFGIFGHDFDKISCYMPERKPKQLRDRFNNYLSHELKNSQWNSEEDDFLRSLVEEHGKNWKIIGKFFPYRTNISVKNRWNSITHIEPTTKTREEIRVEKFMSDFNETIKILLQKNPNIDISILDFYKLISDQGLGLKETHINKDQIAEFLHSILKEINPNKFSSIRQFARNNINNTNTIFTYLACKHPDLLRKYIKDDKHCNFLPKVQNKKQFEQKWNHNIDIINGAWQMLTLDELNFDFDDPFSIDFEFDTCQYTNSETL